jgi:hypothetical protein
MKAPAAIAAEFDHALQDMLVKFQRLRYDPERAAQEAMATEQRMFEYLVMEGVIDV